MDCKHARLLLTFARDRADLDACDADGLEAHLAECPDCAPVARNERRFDHAVGQAMRAVPVPAGLRERLLANLPRPRPWYLSRWLLAPAAVAACLLVAVAWNWTAIFPPPQTLAPFADEKFYFFDPAHSEDEVVEWFKERKVPAAFPPRFDKRQLESTSVASHQGQRVARFRFVHRVVNDQGKSSIIDHAEVLCFDKKRFQATPNASSVPVSHKIYDPGNGFLYLIIYTGSDPFLHTGNGTNIPG